jgi:hypothetical protein
MTYILKSVKSGKTFTTKDPLKDAAWGNAYYGVDDCVRIEVVEPTQAEIDKQELLAKKRCEISAIELKNLRKLYDGIAEMCVLLGVDVSKMTEDPTAVNAERAKLRAEIQALEKVK